VATRWNTAQDVDLHLTLANADGTAATGKAPIVQIRRHRETHGGALDNWFWNGATFVAGPVGFVMPEVPDSPGVYRYTFAQTLVGLEHQYLCYFEHLVDPVGIAHEIHTITDEVFVPTTQPDPIVVGPDSVMGQIELVKDGGTGSFDPATDNLRVTAESALRALGLLHHNAMVDRQTYDYNGNLTSARVRVFGDASQVPAAPGGTETAGLVHEYNIGSSYDGGLVRSFTLQRVL
jgi:hypothetical protein